MSIVFDEVTGSVEPRERTAAREDRGATAREGDEQTGPDEAAMDRWLRRRAD